jgi:hypothetical protein
MRWTLGATEGERKKGREGEGERERERERARERERVQGQTGRKVCHVRFIICRYT